MIACCIHGEGLSYVQRLKKVNKDIIKAREAKGN